MLDVHPPHQSAHSWTDFFIHIATIVVGLLIAIGLEQSVEWVHHRSEVRETRELLKEEREGNVELFHGEVTEVRHTRANLDTNLRVFRFLQKHPGTPLEKLPGIVIWGAGRKAFRESAWMSAKQADVLALMPKPEVEGARKVYNYLDTIEQRSQSIWECVNRASAYKLLQPDESKLTRAEINAEIPLIQDCLYAEGLEVADLFDLGKNALDFSPGPSLGEVPVFDYKEVNKGERDWPRAWGFLNRNLDQARARDRADQPAIEFARELSEDGPKHIDEIFKRVKTHDTDFKPDRDTIIAFGYAELSKKHADQAIAIFKFCGELYPDYWNVYDSLGDAYVAAGDKQLAIESYQHSLKLNPKAESSRSALARLQP